MLLSYNQLTSQLIITQTLDNEERVRFELTEPVSSSDFKSDAIDHSAISPEIDFLGRFKSLVLKTSPSTKSLIYTPQPFKINCNII
jgi:hypothetical protein